MLVVFYEPSIREELGGLLGVLRFERHDEIVLYGMVVEKKNNSELRMA